MQLPDLKGLKRLADMCRKAGIKHYKSADFEFTLTEEAPISNYKKSKANNTVNAALETSTGDVSFKTDTLSDDELLFWSTGNPTDSLENNE